MQEKRIRNRKRSKRRAIYCPVHDCYLDSVSPKYKLFADQVGQLQQRGMGRRASRMLIASRTTVLIQDEWLEEFWCSECQEKQWFHVRELKPRCYELQLASNDLWQQVQNVLHLHGNPSVGDFTKRHSRMVSRQNLQDFRTFV